VRERQDIPTWLKESPMMLRASSDGDAAKLAPCRDGFLAALKMARIPLPGIWYGWKLYRSELTVYDIPTSPWRVTPEHPAPCGNECDGNYPRRPALPGFGQTCAAIRAAGGCPAPYVCLQIYDQGPKDDAPYAPEARSAAVRTVDGAIVNYPGEPSWAMCAFAPWWQQRLADTCRELAVREHVGGVYLDTMNGCGMRCFAENHGHSRGGGLSRTRGMHELARLCREAVRTGNPDAFTSGEDSSENMIDVIDAKLYQYSLHPHTKYPLFATVYQDYIRRYGMKCYVEDGEGFYLSAASLFCEGCMMGRVWIDVRSGAASIAGNPGSQPWEFLSRLVAYYRLDVAKKFLCYSPLVRPLTFDQPSPMPMVSYAESVAKSYLGGRIELPVLQCGVFKSGDGTLGIVLVNVGKDDIRFRALIRLDAYGLTDGRGYVLERIAADGQRVRLGKHLRGQGQLTDLLPGRMPMLYVVETGGDGPP
jgi:hypothetical protein